MSLQSWSESQILTRAAPTLVTEGLPIFKVRRVRCTVSAPAADTLTAVGTMLGWLWIPGLARWSRCPSLDFAISVGGVRDFTGPAMDAELDELAPAGAGAVRVMWSTNGIVTAGAAANVTVRADASDYL